MSLFISGLAFPNQPLFIEEAKIGILAGSVISAVLGYIVLRLTTLQTDVECNDQGEQPSTG
jgi:NhaA family Na+:H+ antiporter